MPRRTEISQEDFDRLLDWFGFGPDRNAAAKLYLATHGNLTAFFRYHYCSLPEDMADETMNRVAKKLPPLNEGCNQIHVLLGFARNVLREWRDYDVISGAEELSGDEPAPADEAPGADEAEIRAACLGKCMSALPEGDLLLEYHNYEADGKIAHRKAMAEARRCSLNSLRLKVSRLKSDVAKCVRRCCQSSVLTQVQ
jgi:hypothetical protein